MFLALSNNQASVKFPAACCVLYKSQRLQQTEFGIYSPQERSGHLVIPLLLQSQTALRRAAALVRPVQTALGRRSQDRQYGSHFPGHRQGGREHLSTSFHGFLDGHVHGDNHIQSQPFLNYSYFSDGV